MRHIGVYLNRARVILLGLFAISFLLLLQTEKFLIFIGQNKEVSVLSQKYVVAYFPALVLLGLIYLEIMFLNLMEYTKPQLICQLICQIFHLGFCYYLVIVQDQGIQGIGYASTLSNLLIYSGIIIYTRSQNDILEVVHWPDAQIFNYEGVMQYMKLGLPSAGMLCIEWWSFEIVVLLSGYMGVNSNSS